jgi:hypothetical protein
LAISATSVGPSTLLRFNGKVSRGPIPRQG